MRTSLTAVALLGLGMWIAGGCASSTPGGDLDGGDDDGALFDAGPDAFVFVDAAILPDGAPGAGFGEACTNRDECDSNICVFSGVGGVCSMLCNPPDCPDGYGCFSVLGGVDPGVVAQICVPDSDRLCSPCSDSSECATAAQDLCVADADGAKWCARDCSTISCPSGYTCSDVTVGAASFKQCLPSSGACDCDDSTQGGTKTCMIATPFGTCLGAKTCAGASGWGACQPPSATDVPDGNFADENCDGIDGDVSKGIFVATTGSDDSTCGLSYQTPCLTVQKGVTRALQTSRSAVYVQAGSYGGVVTLQNNVSIYGGYDTTWQRASRGVAGHETRLVGALDPGENQFMTIKANNLIVPATLADLVIEGPDATGVQGLGGRSSYAVYANASNVTPAAVVLERVTIVAGDGAPGAVGSSGANASSIAASVGMQGGTGGSVQEFNSACNTSAHGEGGPAGTNSCPSGANPNGGPGGAGGEMDTSCTLGQCAVGGDCAATGGDSGVNAIVFQNNVFGFRGVGGQGSDGSCLVVGPGGAGLRGRIANGSGGAKGSGSQLVGTYWFAKDGGTGPTGDNGGGGGGGGGSGGCDAGTDSTGAGGGGGGAGGCMAQSGGGGGGGGGGSFGVFAINSTVSLTGCTIQRGVGGSGGAGGVGGQGQAGGPSGPGGASAADSAAGGAGGAGGHGGHGGGGGGGAGGVSFGVYSRSSTIATSGTSFSGGAPGAGGSGGASAPNAPLGDRDGNPGQSGDAGSMGDSGTCASPSGC
jgi:hypothetical protein